MIILTRCAIIQTVLLAALTYSLGDLLGSRNSESQFNTYPLSGYQFDGYPFDGYPYDGYTPKGYPFDGYPFHESPFDSYPFV